MIFHSHKIKKNKINTNSIKIKKLSYIVLSKIESTMNKVIALLLVVVTVVSGQRAQLLRVETNVGVRPVSNQHRSLFDEKFQSYVVVFKSYSNSFVVMHKV